MDGSRWLRLPVRGLVAAFVVVAASLPLPAVAGEVSAEEQQFVYEVNVARRDPAAFAAANLSGSLADLVASFPARPPLAINDTVAAAAQLRTDDMVENQYFAHYNPTTGDGPREALNAVGYTYSGWGENIGCGYRSAQAMLLGFLGSDAGHRESIMGVSSSALREVGVGYRNDGCGSIYSAGVWTVLLARPQPDAVFVTGVVYRDNDGDGHMDLGEGLANTTVKVGASTVTTNDGGGWSVPVTSGVWTVEVEPPQADTITTTATVGSDNVWVEIAVGEQGQPGLCPDGRSCDTVTFVDAAGQWFRWAEVASGAGVSSFYFGNPGDVPMVGDWDCDGVATPGLYRRADGYVYLRNSNTQGTADIRFYFGNPGDEPLAGDFNGNGCDTVSVYRPAEGRVFVINELGSGDAGLGQADASYFFGNPGDAPFIADFDGDGVDTVGLHRASTGFVYFRDSHTQGIADESFFYGDPGDVIMAADWDGDGDDTVAVYRPSVGRLYVNLENRAGSADLSLWVGSYIDAVGGP